MTVEVSMDYEAVETMAQGFEQAAATLRNVDRALEVAIGVLKASAFMGLAGNQMLALYLEGIRPNVTRLAATCHELQMDLYGAIRALRDGDLSGSRRFVDGGSTGGGSVVFAPVRSYSRANANNYTTGVNGWNVIDMQGAFTPNELLVQSGGSCTIFGAMNLLVANGYDIDPNTARFIHLEQLGTRIYRNPFEFRYWADLLDGEQDLGFERQYALDILDDYGVNYTHSNFAVNQGGNVVGDREAAEDFLIQQLQAGNPVYVSTEVDDSFGMGAGGHAYTVLGVQTDANGDLTGVLVSTNWGNTPVAVIPGDDFMTDWMERGNGEYIVIDD